VRAAAVEDSRLLIGNYSVALSRCCHEFCDRGEAGQLRSYPLAVDFPHRHLVPHLSVSAAIAPRDAAFAIMRAMPNPASFTVLAPLRDGGQVEIRALRPSDRRALLDAVARASDLSLYRRFFGVRREFSDAQVAAFLNADFKEQVALVAVSQASGRELIVAGTRYIVVAAGLAEVAFMVVDEFQGRGIASALLRHLAELARAAGLTAFIAEVLADNTAMLRVLARSGLPRQEEREGDVVHLTLQLG